MTKCIAPKPQAALIKGVLFSVVKNNVRSIIPITDIKISIIDKNMVILHFNILNIYISK
jgi:hypothetical protein